MFNITPKKFTASLGLALVTFTSLAHAESLPGRAEMWQIIQQQQKQISNLMGKQKQTDARIEATADQVQDIQVSGTGGTNAPGWWNRTSIGGYGEMHFNSGKNTDSIDFHRYVLMVNHEFNDRIRMFSELELEHSIAGEGQAGEIELEQAYVEFDLDAEANHRAKVGVFLMPVGIMNETHEPTTFFGVERNNVEKNIIPATWWEGGVAYSAIFKNGISTDIALHSGLNTPTTGGNAYKIRNGRQKVGKAIAKDPAVTARIKWTGVPGVELGISAQYQRDITQGNADTAAATLIETHANIRKGDLGLRALYARWDIDGSAAAAIGRDIQEGWYVEPAYYFDTKIGEMGIFARYALYDNEAGNSTDTEYTQTHVGLNYWPHEDVVLKIDYETLEAPTSASDDNIINIGLGFTF